MAAADPRFDDTTAANSSIRVSRDRQILVDLDGDGYPLWWLPGPFDPAASPNMDCDDQDDTVYPGAGC